MNNKAVKVSVQVKGCGTCGRILEGPADMLRNDYPKLSIIAQQQFSNPTLLVGTFKRPVRINFLHLHANVECLECGQTGQCEVRL